MTYVRTEEIQQSPRVVLSRGQRCRIAGERGLWVFLRHVIGPTGKEWIEVRRDVPGKAAKYAAIRNFRPERLRSAGRRRVVTA